MPAREAGALNDVRARFGTVLREWRLRQQFTQEQLAERAGLSYKFIGELERGQANPTLDTIESLADALGLSIPDLFASFQRDRQLPGAEYRLSRREMQTFREAAESLGELVDHIANAKYRIKRRKKPSAPRGQKI